MPVVDLSCQECGACCVNPPENRDEGYLEYIEVASKDGILRRKDLTRQYTVTSADGSIHLRLAPDGRCLALTGAVGRRVSCRIYQHRPSPCRRVQIGSDACLRHRAAAALVRVGAPSG